MSDAKETVRSAVDAQQRSLINLLPILAVLAALPLLGLIGPVRGAFGITELELAIASAVAGASITVTTAAFRLLGGAHPVFRALELSETFFAQAAMQVLIATSSLDLSPLWALAVAHAGFGAAGLPPERLRPTLTVFLLPPLVTCLVALAQGHVVAGLFAAVMMLVMFALASAGADVGRRLEGLTRERVRLAQELGELRLLRERSRIARDLHDSVGAALASIAWRTAAVAAEVPEASRAELASVAARASQGVDELRSVVWSLHSPERSWSEVVAYVRSRAAELCASGPRLEVEDLGADEGVVLPARVVSDLVGVSLEGVRNAVQHAKASVVRLALGAQGGLVIEVADDGAGLGASPGEGTGLRSMRERATSLGGALTLEPGTPGLRVRLTAPLPAHEATTARAGPAPT